MFLYMCIAQGQGQTTPWEQNFDDNQKALSFCPFVAGLQKFFLKSDFIHIFYVFIHVYSPEQGQTTSWGQNFILPGAGADNLLGSKFYININLLSLWSFVVSFFH